MRKLLIFSAAFLVLLIGIWGTLVLYFDEAKLKQIAIEQVRAQTGRTLQINGPLELDVLPRLALRAMDVTLSGPDGFEGPNLFEADEFSMALEIWPLLRGEIVTGDISLDSARLMLHTDAQGRNSLDGLLAASDQPAAAETAGESATSVTTGRLRLSQSSLTVTQSASDVREVFVVETLQVDSFAFDQPVNFSFEGAIGEPALIDDIDVSGTLIVPKDGGAINVQALGLTAVAAGLPLGLTGRASVDPGPPMVVRFDDGELNLNGKPYRATMAYRDGTPASVNATLRGDYLNADALLAVMPGGDEAVEPADPGESPLLLLKEFDVDARLELGTLVLAGLDLFDVNARVRSTGGVVNVDPLSGRLDGGRLDAVAMADLNVEPPLVQFDPVFELESLSDALAPWGLSSFLSGAGILEMGVSARGLDLNSILASVDGQGKYDFREGSIKGLNLDGMLEALSERNVQQAIASGTGGSTQFERFQGLLEIKEGKIRLPRLNLATPQLGVQGDLVLGLSGLSLDGQLRLNSERLGQVPVRVSGSLYEPKLQPDVGEALKEEAGRRVLDFLQNRSKKSDGEGKSDGAGKSEGEG